MNLSDKIWQDLEGGYKIPYDVSIPLRQLEETKDPVIITKIWEELWDELHHQGDVGLASYLAIPQLVRIAKSKELFDWNVLALCAVIEHRRHSGNNPTLPPEYQSYYTRGLENLRQFVLENLQKDLDETTYIIAIATHAICCGRINLGKAIMEMEDKDLMNEFLEQF